MSEEKLDGEQMLPDLNILLVDGTKIRISGFHVDLIYKLRGLDTWKICDVMNISDADLLGVIEKRRKIYCDIALKYFDKKWEFRDTGDPYSWEERNCNEDVFGIHATGKEIKNLLKRRAKKITLAMVVRIIETFKNEKEIREVEI